MPWRDTTDPYAIWVSETMLQQTQVATVIPYYLRFLARLPTVMALAEAPVDEVLALWAGLGYYSRARNLHAAAGRIVTEHGGRFPSDQDAIRALPGVGPYTAGAILSIAFGRPVPAIDGNVERVLCRLYRIPGAPKRAPARGLIHGRARDLVACSDPGSMTQALMELGAVVCTPTSPDCPECPLQDHCVTRADGTQAQYPQLPPRAPTVRQATAAAVIRSEDKVLLARRPDSGVWAGLWEFPQVEVEGGAHAELALHVRDSLGLVIEVGAPLVHLVHGIMNRRVHLTAYECAVTGGSLQVVGYTQARWLAAGEPATLPLSSPHRKIARRLGTVGEGEST
jgi:A/G-specific adenine glycosylase